MPRTDHCEPQVIAALQKAGWEITHKPCKIAKASGDYYIADLQAQKTNLEASSSIIIVEVKCFPASTTIREEYFRALGQYLVYQDELERQHQEEVLYLSIPLAAYEVLLNSDTLIRSQPNIHIRMIICDLEKEEIVQWIT